MILSATRSEDRLFVQDDRLTIIAVSAVACIMQNVLHEGVGHGVTAWLSGARRVTVSTVAMDSDLSTRWIAANGTLLNLLVAAILWLILRNAHRFQPALRYFLILVFAGNVFTGTGYFLFSGILHFGDWERVTRDLQPAWIWRIAMVAVGVISYYFALRMVARLLAPFRNQEQNPGRLRQLSWTPYFTAGILAFIAGIWNPAGLFYVVASALPSTLGANAGLLSLPSMVRNSRQPANPVKPIARSNTWICVGIAASLVFIAILGRGVTWTR